jgi:hypothetical protein
LTAGRKLRTIYIKPMDGPIYHPKAKATGTCGDPRPILKLSSGSAAVEQQEPVAKQLRQEHSSS